MAESETELQDAGSLMRRAFEAVAAKDLDALRGGWHEDIEEDLVTSLPASHPPAAGSDSTDTGPGPLPCSTPSHASAPPSHHSP